MNFARRFAGLCVAVSLGAALLAGCAPLFLGGVAGASFAAADRRSVGTQVDDQRIQTLGTQRIKSVLDGSENALYTPSTASDGFGYLLSRRQGLLTAWRFDAKRLRTLGEPFPLGLRVGSSGNTGHGAFTVSTNGVLVHSELSVEREIVSWLDRAGRPISPVTGRLAIRGFELSPDGRTLAYGHGDYTVRRDIWLQPMAGGAPARFTFGDGPGWAFPAWSPDGAEIAYATQDRAGEGKYEIRRRRLDRSGAERSAAGDDVARHQRHVLRQAADDGARPEEHVGHRIVLQLLAIHQRPD